MEVKDLIKELDKLPSNAEIYSARIWHIGKISINKETVNKLVNEKENHTFWERDKYTKQRKGNKLPIIKTKEVYTIE